MRKYIKYILILVCVAILMVGQYWFLTRDDLSNSIFCDSSISSVALQQDVVLQIADDIKEALLRSDKGLYKKTDFQFYMEIADDIDPTLIESFHNGEWLRVRCAYKEVYIMKPEKDPYILGMKEILEQTTQEEVKATIEDYVLNDIYYREDLSKNPQEREDTLYVYFDYAQRKKYSYDPTLSTYEIYDYYQRYNDVPILVALHEQYPPMDTELLKQRGREAAESLAADTLKRLPVPFAFAVVDDTPTVLYGDLVYQYGISTGRDFPENAAMASSAWTPLENVADATRLFSGEYLGYLDAAGKLHYETYFEEIAQVMEEGKQLSTLAYYYHDLAKQALEINEKEPFVAVNGPVNSDFRALLQDGSLIYYDFHEFKHYKPQEEIRKLAGPFLLTASGNVYMLYMDDSSPLASERKVICDLVYGGGNITDISGSAKGFVVLTAEGKAVSWVSEWWKEQHALPDLSDWENLKEVILGDSGLVVGLTVDGTVICRHVEEEITEKVQDSMDEWAGIVAIEEYNQKLYALDKDGNCYGVDFSPVLEDTEAECILLEF